MNIRDIRDAKKVTRKNMAEMIIQIFIDAEKSADEYIQREAEEAKKQDKENQAKYNLSSDAVYDSSRLRYIILLATLKSSFGHMVEELLNLELEEQYSSDKMSYLERMIQTQLPPA